MTYIGDGGQSTGVTYEGLNFAAVQDLGLVLFVENNLWAYSTPSDMQFRVKDLAERAIAYGIPGVIVDGTDPARSTTPPTKPVNAPVAAKAQH